MAISSSLTSLSKTLNLSHPRATIFNILRASPNTQLRYSLNLKPRPLSLQFTTHNPKSKSQLKSRHSTIGCLFTGIVEEIGEVRELGFADDSGCTMIIHAKTILEDANLGDSISVNGTCLTVAQFDTQLSEFTVGLAPETLGKTSLIELKTGSLVNLERAVKPSTRMGGHFVQGHVDGTGEIVATEPEGDSLWVEVKTGPELLKYIVPKGFKYSIVIM